MKKQGMDGGAKQNFPFVYVVFVYVVFPMDIYH